jgi:hypothetical protein
MAWFNFTESMTDPDARITSDMAKGWWKNVISAARGETGSPYIETAWHPYNGVTVGDGATGTIWDFATDGAVTVDGPLFQDGFTYRLVVNGFTASGLGSVGAGAAIEARVIGATSGTAHLIENLASLAFGGDTGAGNGWCDLEYPRTSQHRHHGMIANNVAAPVGFLVSEGTAQKLSRYRLTFTTTGGATITGGRCRMFRKRLYE